MTVEQVWHWLDRMAPFASQAAFDNAGLVVGDPGAEVRRVLFAVDATLAVVQEAALWEATLIVTHHPLLFGGAKQIRSDLPEGKVLAALLGSGLNLISAHTNLDQAQGGTGDSLANTLGLVAVQKSDEDAYLRHGLLRTPAKAGDFLAEVNTRLKAHARLYGDLNAPVRHVAVGAGAYGEGYALAARLGAQAFVVGEIKHHDLLAAQAQQLLVYEAGHHETEYPGIRALSECFQSAAQTAGWRVQTRLTTIQPYACHTQ